MLNVMFDVFFFGKELCRNVRVPDDCEGLAAERTHDAFSREVIHKKKLRRAGESPEAGAVFHEKRILNVLWEQMLPALSDSFLLNPKTLQLEWRTLFQQGTARR